MLKVTDDNYDYYKRVFQTLWTFQANLMGVDQNVDHSPIKVLNAMENESMTIAKQGLKAGLNDMITMSIHLSYDMKQEISAQLLAKGLPSFNQLADTIKGTIQKVLNQGKIKTLDDYYIVKEFIIDQGSDISKADRYRLDKLLSDFEIRSDKNKNAS